MISLLQSSRRVIVAVLILILVIPSPVSRAQGTGDLDPPEIRALWVDAFHDGYKTQRQADQLITDARRGNFNTLFVQVRRRGDAYFNSRIEPRTEDSDLTPGFDPLQYLIDRAHNEEPRIEIHAWVSTLPIWSKRDVLPRDYDHVMNQHGPGKDGGDYWLMRQDDGETWDGEGYGLDPGNPDAAAHIVNVLTSIVRTYDVDGLHLDRVRYSEGNPAQRRWGYNMASVARFNDRYGRNGNPDPNDPQWASWRREQLTSLVRRIYLESVAIRPNVKISAAVIPWGRNPTSDEDWQRSSAYSAVFQDWRCWLTEGILDLAVTMNYSRDDNPSQRQWFDGWAQWLRDQPNNRQVIMGLGAYLNPPASTFDQIDRVRAAGGSGGRLTGVSLYSYAVTNRTQVNDDPGDDVSSARMLSAFASSDALIGRGSIFNRRAPIPEMGWKSFGDRGHLSVTLGREFDGAKIKLIGPDTREQAVDGNGFAGFVDLPTGKYELTVEHPLIGRTSRTRTEVVGGRVSRVDPVDALYARPS